MRRKSTQFLNRSEKGAGGSLHEFSLEPTLHHSKDKKYNLHKTESMIHRSHSQDDDSKSNKKSEKAPGDLAYLRYKAETHRKGMNDKQAEETSKELLEKIKSNLKEEKIYN